MSLRRPAVVLAGAACAALMLARVLNEFVPDALGIGVSMFAGGALGGFVAGILYGDHRRELARGAGRALERMKKFHDDDKE